MSKMPPQPEILFICHTIIMIMTQTQAIIILGVIPYKYNRLIKTKKESKMDEIEMEKKELKE